MRNLITILAGLLASHVAIAQVTEIIDNTSAPNGYDGGSGIAVDSNGNVYTGSLNIDSVYRITPGGVISEVMNSAGDGVNAFDRAQAIIVDGNDNVYVAGQFSDNVFRIAASDTCSTTGTSCTITEIIDSTGDGTGDLGMGTGNFLDSALALGVDASNNIYVGGNSDNVFRIVAPTTCSVDGTPCDVEEIIDETGDGSGNVLTQVTSIAVDSSNNVFVMGQGSDNIFRVGASTTCSTGGTPCAIAEIADATGDGTQGIDFPRALAVDSSDNVFVNTFFAPRSVFQIDTPTTCSTTGTPCTITQLITGLAGPIGLAIDGNDNLFVADANADEVIRIEAPMGCSTTGSACMTSTIVGATGDTMGNILDGPNFVTVSGADVYVSALTSDNAFEVAGAALPVELQEFSVD